MLKICTFFELDQFDKSLQKKTLQQFPSILQEQILRRQHEKARILSIAAWKLLFDNLQQENLLQEPLRTLRISTNPHGKPYFPDHPDLHFNLSHCPLGCVCAIADRPIGIDIQDIRPYRPNVARKCCSSAELKLLSDSADQADTFARIWALKESYAKLTGQGIAQDLSTIDTTSLQDIVHVTFQNGCYIAYAFL